MRMGHENKTTNQILRLNSPITLQGNESQKAIVWLIWQLGSINIGTNQSLVVLVFRLLNCAISKWI